MFENLSYLESVVGVIVCCLIWVDFYYAEWEGEFYTILRKKFNISGNKSYYFIVYYCKGEHKVFESSKDFFYSKKKFDIIEFWEFKGALTRFTYLKKIK